MTEPRAAHSPKGASSSERWMNCPGSVELIKNLSLPQTDEPEYRREGTAAHEALALCLLNAYDAWEVVNRTMSNGVVVSIEMADAVQVFLAAVRDGRPPGLQQWVEVQIDNPEFHPQFYGTVDLGLLYTDLLEVDDLKYGLGVIVEVWHNPQIMYYAYGLLMKLPKADRPSKVRLRIIQPRAFHPDGPVREWIVDADVIISWAENTLRPAMSSTSVELVPGPHCRFCPAKLVCPVMTSLFEAAVSADPKRVVELNDAALDVQYPMIEAVKFYLKALEEETFRRLQAGKVLSHSKLVHKKANRVWKPGAEAVLKLTYTPEQLYDPPTFKSPAEIEKLGGRARPLVHEYAFTPESGLTVASTSDKRVGVKVPASSETFAAYLEKPNDP